MTDPVVVRRLGAVVFFKWTRVFCSKCTIFTQKKMSSSGDEGAAARSEVCRLTRQLNALVVDDKHWQLDTSGKARQSTLHRLLSSINVTRPPLTADQQEDLWDIEREALFELRTALDGLFHERDGLRRTTALRQWLSAANVPIDISMFRSKVMIPRDDWQYHYAFLIYALERHSATAHINLFDANKRWRQRIKHNPNLGVCHAALDAPLEWAPEKHSNILFRPSASLLADGMRRCLGHRRMPLVSRRLARPYSCTWFTLSVR